MKAIISVMFVMIMAFALVSNVEAGTCSGNLDNHGVLSGAHNTPVAYTDYVDARDFSAPAKGLQTPQVMGSW